MVVRASRPLPELGVVEDLDGRHPRDPTFAVAGPLSPTARSARPRGTTGLRHEVGHAVLAGLRSARSAPRR
jgi:hypothetical protein